MIYTVTLNPAVDRTLLVRPFRPGELNRVSEKIDNAGGKGINVSLALVELGADTTACGFLGGDSGRWLDKAIRTLGVKGSWINISGETRTNIKVRDLDSGQVTELNEAGPQISSTEWGRLTDWVTQIGPTASTQEGDGIIVFAGNPPKGSPETIYAELVGQAKAQGLYTVLDTNGVYLEAGLQAGPHLVKPNLEELSTLVGRKLESVTAAAEAAQQIIAAGVDTVVVSLGGDGALYCRKGETILAVPPSVDVRSTVGCGDALVAGTVYAISQHKSLADTARWGAAAGTAAATTEGTQPGSRALVLRLFGQVSVQNLC